MAKNPNIVALSYEDLVFKFGRNPAVGATEEIIWDGSAAYPGFLTTEAACEIISDNPDDKSGSGGAVTARVWGQGNDGLELIEDVTLNANIAAVALGNDYKIIYRVRVLTSEDADPITGPNHGTLTIRKTAGPVTMALVLPTNGSTLMCIYRVPSDKYGELRDISFYANEGKEANIKVKVRQNQVDENAWQTRMTLEGFQNEVGQELRNDPRFLYPGADVIALATSAAAGVIVSGHFSVRLYDL